MELTGYIILLYYEHMKPIIDKIVNVLSEAEKQLRGLIGEAATEGDYRGVDAARQAAVGIQDIRDCFIERTSRKVLASDPSPPNVKSAVRKGSASRKGTRSAYPKFVVGDDTLTKIGWSKKHKREYAQRVAAGTFDRTVQAMAGLANGKTGPVLAEDIISKVNQSDCDQVSSYQVYIVIAFLRSMGCIRQQGRDGYNIHGELIARAREGWEKFRQSS